MSDFDIAAMVVLSAAFAAGVWARGAEWSAGKLGVSSVWLDRLTFARKTWIVVLGILMPVAYVVGSLSHAGNLRESAVVWAVVAVGLAMVVIGGALCVCVLQLRRAAAQQGIPIPLWVDSKLVEPQPYERVNVSFRRVFKAAAVVLVLWILAFAVGMWWLSRGM